MCEKKKKTKRNRLNKDGWRTHKLKNAYLYDLL